MPNPIDDEDVFELPEGDAKVQLPKEDGEVQDQRAATGKPDAAPGDDLDGEEQPQDQLGMARRHNRRLESRLKQYRQETAGLREQVREIGDTLHRLTRSTLQQDLRSAHGSVEAAEQRLVRARDDGDRQQELNAERDLAKERSRLDTLERAVSSAAEERQPAPDPQPPPAEEDVRLELAKELAGEWSQKHPWYGARNTTEESEIVRAISTAIANDPSNPLAIDDPEHFTELDRRLARRLPERYRPSAPPARRTEEMDDDRPDVSGTRGSSRRTAPAPVGNGASDLPESLTQRQLRVYEEMGFKWNDKADQERIIAMEKKLVEERKDRRHG